MAKWPRVWDPSSGFYVRVDNKRNVFLHSDERVADLLILLYKLDIWLDNGVGFNR